MRISDWSSDVCSSDLKYLGWLEACPNLDCPPFGTPFAAIFGPGCTEDATTTMMQALWLDDTQPLPPNGLGGPSPVLAHSAAAYCNPQFFGKSTYGLAPDEVVQLVVRMIPPDPFGLKDILEPMHERGSRLRKTGRAPVCTPLTN